MLIHREELLHSLPAEWPEDLLPAIREQVSQAGKKIVVLDDDPTGTQTVHDVTVLTTWTVEALETVLREPDPVVYILTNSRSFSLSEAQALNREIAAHLLLARRVTGRDFVVVSRSDSTLRGHYPGEVQALVSELGESFDGTLVVPFFLEGGRFTIDDVHYVAEGDRLVPAGETEYARDATFGYTHSNLKAWVSEKHGGRVSPEEVCSISIAELRSQGPSEVARHLRQVQGGQVCIVNAAAYRDLEVFVAGLLQAEAAGKRFLYRTAASFVRVRGGLEPYGLVAPQALRAAAGAAPGLVVAGSYIQKSGLQIQEVQALPGVVSLEVQVEALLDPDRREAEIEHVAQEADRALAAGTDALVYTSRRLVSGADREEALSIGRSVSTALVDIVRRIQSRPGWVIAKGGITSADVASRGLGVKRARVLGQAIPGVPVWTTGLESRWPGVVYVVFPGNVGGPGALAEVVKAFRSERF